MFGFKSEQEKARCLEEKIYAEQEATKRQVAEKSKRLGLLCSYADLETRRLAVRGLSYSEAFKCIDDFKYGFPKGIETYEKSNYLPNLYQTISQNIKLEIERKVIADSSAKYHDVEAPLYAEKLFLTFTCDSCDFLEIKRELKISYTNQLEQFFNLSPDLDEELFNVSDYYSPFYGKNILAYSTSHLLDIPNELATELEDWMRNDLPALVKYLSYDDIIVSERLSKEKADEAGELFKLKRKDESEKYLNQRFTYRKLIGKS